jgi:alpha-L-fucosidase
MEAERWDPDALVKLYKRAGAEYLVSLATHHDNFDCWNSKYQPWNCVNIGPKRDIVGTWEKVARENGLRFGVSYHGTPHRVWDEFLPVRYQSDATGPLAGVPYDGMQTIADGKGKWWEGMDPQMINGKPHLKNSPCPEFVQQFLLRVQDVIDQVQSRHPQFRRRRAIRFRCRRPQTRLEGVAGHSRSGPANHGLLLQQECAGPRRSPGRSGRPERGSRAGMGHTHPRLRNVPGRYASGEALADRGMHRSMALRSVSVFENHTYQKASFIIPFLVDIVSKNGNLLLSIPLPGYGEPDSDEIAFLGELADWQQVNSEAIKGTRPWSIFG